MVPLSFLLSLQDLETARAVTVPGVYEPMQIPSGEAASPTAPVKPQISEEDMHNAVQVSMLGDRACGSLWTESEVAWKGYL